jgi:hypothetical protein
MYGADGLVTEAGNPEMIRADCEEGAAKNRVRLSDVQAHCPNTATVLKAWLGPWPQASRLYGLEAWQGVEDQALVFSAIPRRDQPKPQSKSF